jgi:hypothetical protein
MTREKMFDIARGNVERHLGDVAGDYESVEDAADSIYDECYTLAFDALHDAGVDELTAGAIAREVALLTLHEEDHR